MYIFNVITLHFLSPKTSTDSVAITIKLSRAFFSQKYNKKFHNLYGNTNNSK